MDADANRLRQCLSDLSPAFKRLDSLLEQAVAVAERIYGPEAAADPYRGLHIGAEDVDRLLARPPGKPLFVHEVKLESGEDREPSRLQWLAKTFGLSSFDLDLILLALAPEFDLRYERLYAYLQDDVNRRRPTVDLALNLLCATTEEKLARRIHFLPDAPLLRHGLLHVLPEPGQTQPPWLAHSLRLDSPVAGFLLGHTNMDSRLAHCAQLRQPDANPYLALGHGEIVRRLLALLREASASQRPTVLYLHNAHSDSVLSVAQVAGGTIGLPLLVVDIARALATPSDFEQTLKLSRRQAKFQRAVLYLGGIDALQSGGQTLNYHWLMEWLAEGNDLTILGGTEPLLPSSSHQASLIAIEVPLPPYPVRRECWRQRLDSAGIALADADVDRLADHFRLTPEQIDAAVEWACNCVRSRLAAQGGDGKRVETTVAEADMFAAARAQAGRDLAKLARKVNPRYCLADIVLPPDHLAHLEDICIHAKHRHVVYGEWGFDRKLSLGKGMNVLFSGPPGTGKTMAAEVLAHELRLDLYKIDLSQIVSKYIGETEKNLDRIFTAAQSSNAILFFDEADAIFGKRSEVKDAHDRYANIEVGYLLQKMEEYDGVAILATNLRQHMDEAFVRRMHYILEFPFPDEEQRKRIWEVTFPQETPMGEDVDFEVLAREVRLAGGNIKNIALSAAFHAASDGKVVRMPHLFCAAKREHQKLGRTWEM